MLLAEKLRQTIHGLGMEHTGSALGVLTISIGVATMADGSGIVDQEDLIREADAALYAAKAAGRNRVMAAEPGRRLAANG